MEDTITNGRGETLHVGDAVLVNTFAGSYEGTIVTIWAFGATPIAVQVGRLVVDFAAEDVSQLLPDSQCTGWGCVDGCSDCVQVTG